MHFNTSVHFCFSLVIIPFSFFFFLQTTKIHWSMVSSLRKAFSMELFLRPPMRFTSSQLADIPPPRRIVIDCHLIMRIVVEINPMIYVIIIRSLIAQETSLFYQRNRVPAKNFFIKTIEIDRGERSIIFRNTYSLLILYSMILNLLKNNWVMSNNNISEIRGSLTYTHIYIDENKGYFLEIRQNFKTNLKLTFVVIIHN